jgi:Protein kinase domain.
MMEIPEKVLSKYSIKSCISEEKNIYKAVNLNSGEECAVKYISGDNSDIYHILKVSSPEGIPKIYDIFEGEKGFFIAERYIEGETLTDYIAARKNVISEMWVRNFIIGLCMVLERIHTLNPPVIHRDLKPDNIIISIKDEIYLIDFNISRFYVDKAGKGETNRDTLIMGTVDYAAPEQFGFMESDARTDIYGLGATIEYIMDKTGIESSEISTVVNKCKQFSPGDRYQSVREIISHFMKPADQNNMPYNYQSGIQNDGIINQPEKYYDKKDKSDGASGKSGYNKYAPPGFRSGSFLKMLAASIIYLLSFSIAIHLNANTDNIPLKYEVFVTWWNRISMLIAFMLMIFFSANYLDIQKKVIKEENTNYVKRIVLIILTDVVIFVFFAAEAGIVDYLLSER